ncbi:MAG: DUF4344 domain-containing metallopeptidase [Myxococcota bacterium]|nr:DUF4344 domain-containing metallopeptidase [Myxococcota bacterium]
MNIRAGVALALLLCASCKKSDYFDKASQGSGSATAKTDEAPNPSADTGSATAGSAAPQVAHDPWSGGPPPGSDTNLGADCGPKLNKIDPWDQAPKPKDDNKVDVAQIEPARKDKVEIKDFGGVSTTSGFKVTYNPSRIKNHEEYRALFEANRMFDSVAEGLNRTVRLPNSVEINTVTCNTINAFYDPRSRRIIVCYELLDYFVGMFKPTAKNEEELGNAVMGATMFGFFHEVGHGLIDQLDLPAVGREEDSVDQLATLILIAGGEKGVAQALAGAYWFQLQSKSNNKTPFWDEHAFDQQRFYNIVCLIFGSDPKKYGDFVNKGTLPMERAMRCPDEYTKIKKAWEKLLQPHLTNGAALNMNYTPSVPTKEAPKGNEDPFDDQDKPVPTPAGEEISCEAVAIKAAELIGAEAEERARKMSREEIAELKQKLETELPAALEKILAECAKSNWSQQSRKCVLDAKSLAQAAKCN